MILLPAVAIDLAVAFRAKLETPSVLAVMLPDATVAFPSMPVMAPAPVITVSVAPVVFPLSVMATVPTPPLSVI